MARKKGRILYCFTVAFGQLPPQVSQLKPLRRQEGARRWRRHLAGYRGGHLWRRSQSERGVSLFAGGDFSHGSLQRSPRLVVGNPGRASAQTFRKRGPTFAVWPLIEETFGLTTNTNPYVYLSDGGHFENLGFYEMVLRRCHVIIVSDAGCDPKCELDDLGGAVRKVRADFGVPIEFTTGFHVYARGNRSGRRCAVGIIRYSAVDGGDPKQQDGVLIYLKPCFYNANEPVDVVNYASVNQTFPHESTSDQWFSESQFESYRMLGLHTVNEICGDPWLGTTLEDLITAAKAAASLPTSLPSSLTPASPGDSTPSR